MSCSGCAPNVGLDPVNETGADQVQVVPLNEPDTTSVCQAVELLTEFTFSLHMMYAVFPDIATVKGHALSRLVTPMLTGADQVLPALLDVATYSCESVPPGLVRQATTTLFPEIPTIGAQESLMPVPERY